MECPLANVCSPNIYGLLLKFPKTLPLLSDARLLKSEYSCGSSRAGLKLYDARFIKDLQAWLLCRDLFGSRSCDNRGSSKT